MYRPTWITIPVGRFIMGSDPRDAAPPFADEQPAARLVLPVFRISRVPVTNAQYHAFVAATAYPPPGHWLEGQPPGGSEQHPVTYVSWSDAQAFCAWAGVRLPSEAEWEKAARGPASLQSEGPDEAHWWPWGNDLPDATRAHFDGQTHGVAPAAQSVLLVGQFPRGASPYGLLDMAGNVWEWTNSLYRGYPYDAEDGREARASPGPRVVRGGSYNHDLRRIRCAARTAMAPGARDVYIGFRVVAVSASPALDLDWVSIPAGPFWMGSERRPRRGAVLPSELPVQQLMLPGFRIAQTPVTNQEYAGFVRTTGHPPPTHWFGGEPPPELAQHPVTYVDWDDANAFCRWAGVRLPSEAEWEKAARGPASSAEGALIYPWGNTPPDRTRLNYRRTRQDATTPVDQYPRGASPYSVLDMAGNVWEWTSSLYAPYPYQAEDGREDQQARSQRVLRGGSFASPSARFVRCAMRSLSYPTRRREHIGFRVAQPE